MQTYFSTDYAQINYDAESNAIVFIWLTPPSYDEFRNSMEQIIEAEQYFKTGKLIVDTSQQGTIHPDNQEWVANDWTERAIERGHTHAAIIMPKDIFAIMSIDDMMVQVKGIIVGYFNNMKEAIEWIKQA